MYTLRIETYAHSDGETIAIEEIPCGDRNTALLKCAEGINAGDYVCLIEATYGALIIGIRERDTDR